MIGILCKVGEIKVVKEFFELFKTPWDFYSDNKPFTVLISSLDTLPENVLQNGSVKTKIIFNSKPTNADTDIHLNYIKKGCIPILSFCQNANLPIYNGLATFTEKLSLNVSENMALKLLQTQDNKESACINIPTPSGNIIRVGYDLFKEIEFLLTKGQPTDFALFPTLDMHIVLLRYLIVMSGVPVLECPPIPKGYKFMAALTHDVDFAKLKNHFFDKTMLGFIYNITIGSLIDFIFGRRSFKNVLLNFKAFFLLPFIYLGLYEDIWNEFERYGQLEKNYKSTFFIIPFKNWSGKNIHNKNGNQLRATKYDVDDIGLELKQIATNGFEVGVHGLDAWYDIESGQREKERIIKEVGENKKMGIRIHWLYFNEDSYQVIERSGYYYDSTCGYNDAIGFRAGTLQVFCPLNTEHLKELPLHIQDTALFYPKRMYLTERKAMQFCDSVFEKALHLGGVLTILWHTRSISQDRLWGKFYQDILHKLNSYNVWIDKSVNIVDWFTKRRSLVFKNINLDINKVQYELDLKENNDTPPLQLRLYKSVKDNNDISNLLNYDELDLSDTLLHSI